jgi:cell division protein FtsW (lipid II flippase)
MLMSWSSTDLSSSVSPPPTHRQSRWYDLPLIVGAQLIGYSAFLLTHLFMDNALPSNWLIMALAWFPLGIIAFFMMRWKTPYADPVIMPIVLCLIGLGLAMVHRIDLIADPVNHRAETQLMFIWLGVLCLAAVLFFIRDPRRLKVIPIILFIGSVILLLMPLIPFIGVETNGARVWINIAGLSFQPAEIAKITLAMSFAGYLSEKGDVLASGGKRFLGMTFPRLRDLAPLAIMWGVSLLILIGENDLGTSLLFFGLFVVLLYVATGKGSWILLGGGLFVVGAIAAFRFVGHARQRFDYWLHPFEYPDASGQIINGQFGLAWGGLFGTGWGLGRPGLTTFSWSDMISTSLGEEIGIVGLFAIIMLYALLIFRGLKAASDATDSFIKLLAAGLSFSIALQVFAIIGGATRLLPLTGLTTPFLSQGGSSMVANLILIGFLLLVSHQARRPPVVMEKTDSEGVTDLDNDMTQVISTRELRTIGVGQVQPVMAIDGVQVTVPHEEPTVMIGSQGAPTEAELTAQVPGYAFPGTPSPGTPSASATEPVEGEQR